MTCFMRLVGLLVMLAMVAPPIAAFSLRRLAAMEYQAAMIPSLAACYIENGYDYVGNDLTNKPGSVDQCCGLCAGTKDCKAWSWSGFNGGTCWLKWAQGDVIVNPEVKSALLLFSPPLYCQLQNDVDYVDNDLVRLDSKTANGCCDLCHSYPGCRAYTWSNFGEGSCWLKSKVTKTVPKTGVKSAKAYPDVQFNCPNLEYGLDYVDHDIDNKHADKPEMCCDICKANPNCRAFSWSGHNSGTCWLKSMKGAAVWTPGVVSAQIAPNPPPCVLQDNMDLFDNDFANVPNTPDPQDCCDICRNKPPCKAFAWSDYQGGTCWLKTAKGTSTGKLGVKSGWI